jgi:VanZ family protein
MKTRLKYLAIGLFCFYMAAILALCLINTDSLPELPKTFLGIPLDKFVHFMMFFPFTILGYSAFAPEAESKWKRLTRLLIIILSGSVFIFSTEKLQALTSYRSYELMDMTADSLGLIAGGLLTFIIIAKTRK